LAENKNKIGEGYVEYTADTTKLEAGAAKADAAFKQSAQGAEQAGKAVGDNIKKGTEEASKGFAAMGKEAADGIGKTISFVSRFAGHIGLAVAALSALALGAKKAWDALVDLGVNAEKTGIRLSSPMDKAFKGIITNVEELQKLGKVPFLNTESMTLDKKNLEELQKQLYDYQAALADAKEENEGSTLGKSDQEYFFEGKAAETNRKINQIKARQNQEHRTIEAANEEALIEKSLDRSLVMHREGLTAREQITVSYEQRRVQLNTEKDEAIKKNRLELSRALDMEIDLNERARLRSLALYDKKITDDAIRDRRQAELSLMDERTRIAEEAEDKIAEIKLKVTGKNREEISAEARKAYEDEMAFLARLKQKQLDDYDKKQREARDKEIKEQKEKEERIAKDKQRIQEDFNKKMEDQKRGFDFDNVVQSINAMNANLAEVIRTSAR
jgi:hypothetical protein